MGEVRGRCLPTLVQRCTLCHASQHSWGPDPDGGDGTAPRRPRRHGSSRRRDRSDHDETTTIPHRCRRRCCGRRSGRHRRLRQPFLLRPGRADVHVPRIDRRARCVLPCSGDVRGAHRLPGPDHLDLGGSVRDEAADGDPRQLCAGCLLPRTPAHDGLRDQRGARGPHALRRGHRSAGGRYLARGPGPLSLRRRADRQGAVVRDAEGSGPFLLRLQQDPLRGDGRRAARSRRTAGLGRVPLTLPGAHRRPGRRRHHRRLGSLCEHRRRDPLLRVVQRRQLAQRGRPHRHHRYPRVRGGAAVHRGPPGGPRGDALDQ